MIISEICTRATHPKGISRPRPLHGDIILQELIIMGKVTIGRLIDQFYYSREDGGPEWSRRCVYMAMFHLRSRLKPGYTISSHQNTYILHVPDDHADI